LRMRFGPQYPAPITATPSRGGVDSVCGTAVKGSPLERRWLRLSSMQRRSRTRGGPPGVRRLHYSTLLPAGCTAPVERGGPTSAKPLTGPIRPESGFADPAGPPSIAQGDGPVTAGVIKARPTAITRSNGTPLSFRHDRTTVVCRSRASSERRRLFTVLDRFDTQPCIRRVGTGWFTVTSGTVSMLYGRGVRSGPDHASWPMRRVAWRRACRCRHPPAADTGPAIPDRRVVAGGGPFGGISATAAAITDRSRCGSQ
jgi:hypothetical protein